MKCLYLQGNTSPHIVNTFRAVTLLLHFSDMMPILTSFRAERTCLIAYDIFSQLQYISRYFFLFQFASLYALPRGPISCNWKDFHSKTMILGTVPAQRNGAHQRQFRISLRANSSAHPHAPLSASSTVSFGGA